MQLLSQLQETSDHDALPNGDGDHLGCRDDGDLDHLDTEITLYIAYLRIAYW